MCWAELLCISVCVWCRKYASPKNSTLAKTTEVSTLPPLKQASNAPAVVFCFYLFTALRRREDLCSLPCTWLLDTSRRWCGSLGTFGGPSNLPDVSCLYSLGSTWIPKQIRHFLTHFAGRTGTSRGRRWRPCLSFKQPWPRPSRPFVKSLITGTSAVTHTHSDGLICQWSIYKLVTEVTPEFTISIRSEVELWTTPLHEDLKVNVILYTYSLRLLILHYRAADMLQLLEAKATLGLAEVMLFRKCLPMDAKWTMWGPVLYLYTSHQSSKCLKKHPIWNTLVYTYPVSIPCGFEIQCTSRVLCALQSKINKSVWGLPSTNINEYRVILQDTNYPWDCAWRNAFLWAPMLRQFGPEIAMEVFQSTWS